MVSITSCLILFTSITLLSFRLTRSYQLSFIALICSYLFIESSLGTSNPELERKLFATFMLCAVLYLVLHKIAVHLLTSRSELAHNYPLAFVSIFFTAHIIASIMIHTVPKLNNHISLLRSPGVEWLMAICSIFCAFNVYHARGTHRIVIIGSSLLVSAVLYSLLLGHAFSASALVGFAGPWSWLILMRATDRKSWVSRLLIAMTIAAAPLLQLAPHPLLTQLTGLPIIVAGVVCLGDILRSANTQSKLIAAIPITALIASLLALALQFSFQ